MDTLNQVDSSLERLLMELKFDAAHMNVHHMHQKVFLLQRALESFANEFIDMIPEETILVHPAASTIKVVEETFFNAATEIGAKFQ